MVKKSMCLIILLIFSGCFYTRTQYGMIRFKQNRFSIKPNSNDNVYKIIDTTKLYELIDVIDTIHNQKMYSVKKEFLKFYTNGRLGEFDIYNKGDVKSLEPMKAKMAYYNYDGKDLVVEFYFEHPQGGGLIKEKFYKLKKDTLELMGETNLSKYKIIDIPKEFLIYKPDW
jgi:hypothetical protein